MKYDEGSGFRVGLRTRRGIRKVTKELHCDTARTLLGLRLMAVAPKPKTLNPKTSNCLGL